MAGSFSIYALYWQFRKSLKSVHFNVLFFLLSQLIWPLILIGTYYLSYSPLLDPAQPGESAFTGGADFFSYLMPGVIVVYLYLEYVSIGFGLAVDRDYGVLEPILITPVNRIFWLFGTASSAMPASLLASAGFIFSSALFFGISVPHPLIFCLFILVTASASIPWGAMVCAIFLCGRNSRFLYAVFETPAEFFSGSRFPLAALPSVLSAAAMFYPLSHSVVILRCTLQQTISWSNIKTELVWIAGLCVLYSTAAALLFSFAEYKGKRDGTLTFS